MSANITTNACVAALTQAAMSQKKITHVQMAVGLSIFMLEGAATEKAKDSLVATYARAGLDCASYTGSEYSTVRRKVGASSVLFKTIGAEQVAAWIGAEKNGRAISAIADQLGQMKLDSIERVLAHCGAAPSVRPKVEPIRREQPARGDRQAFLFEMETPHVRIHVDLEATEGELREAVGKLEALIQERTQVKAA